MKKPVILIDLDGVLNEYNGDFDEKFIPKIKPDTKKFINKLSKDFAIKIFTTRNALLTSKWLIENKLDKFVDDVTNIKIPAFLYLDDRCICFNGNFDEIYNRIKNFNVYWKNSK